MSLTSRADDFDKALTAATPKLRHQVRALCKNAELAEDILQETMAKALQAHASFVPGTNLAAWLYTIARNQYFSVCRRLRREVDDPEGDYVASLPAVDNPEQAIIVSQALDAVDALPKDMRKAVRLVGMWGYSYQEAAGEVGVPIGTIKSRVGRARLLLRDESIKALLPADDTENATLTDDDDLDTGAEVAKIMAGLEGDAHRLPPTETTDTRSIAPVKLPKGVKPKAPLTDLPSMRIVDPRSLRVEPSYQRDLSKKSVRLIRRIVENWSWSKFKPPICSDTPFGLVVIDGQHTAIAAATHPEIDRIPVLVAKAEAVEDRAAAFVSHNRDRLAMSPLQVFHAEVAAGNGDAFTILKAAIAAGCEIPRSAPIKGTAKPGQATAISAFQRIFKTDGQATLARIFRIARLADAAPLASTLARALQILLKGEMFVSVAALSDEAIAAAIRSIRDIETEAQALGSETGQNRYRACALLISNAARQPNEAAA